MSNERENDEERAGVALTHLDTDCSTARATKRDLVDYLDAVSELIIRQLADRPLSVIRVRPGQAPFMQKNVPKYAPDFVRTVTVWAESSHREVAYALCNDRRTLLWFANQRAVEYHPTLMRAGSWDSPDFLVLDIDPPSGAGFGRRCRPPCWCATALELGRACAGAVKTSGAKGVHVFVPLAAGTTSEDAAAATRAIAARAERLGPGAGDYRVHPRGPGREGVPRRHQGRRRDRRRRVQPAGPAGHAGVLPGGLG